MSVITYRFNSAKVIALLKAVEAVIDEKCVGQIMEVGPGDYDRLVDAYMQIADIAEAKR